MAVLKIPFTLYFGASEFTNRADVQRITLKIKINQKWENEDKVVYLKEWIPAKVKKVFEVISMSAGEFEWTLYSHNNRLSQPTIIPPYDCCFQAQPHATSSP